MALPNTASTLSDLSLRRVQDRLLNHQDAERIRLEALNNKVSFVTQMVGSKELDSASIARIASDAFGIPLFEIDALGLETDRVGIYQVMPVTPAMGEIIMRGGNQIDIEAEPCKSGFSDLRELGLKKICDGVTSLAEIKNVTDT